ncbi:MAG: hypothetical protein ACOH2K_14255 [Burkholderiaceae bacterium]
MDTVITFPASALLTLSQQYQAVPKLPPAFAIPMFLEKMAAGFPSPAAVL